MKILIFTTLFVAAANAQFLPGFPFAGYPFPGYGGLPSDDQYAASLGGAPVGIYDKKHYGGGPFGGGPFGGGLSSDVSGASLGGAKVGIYGKERPQAAGPPVLPFAAALPIFSPILPNIPRLYAKPVRPVRPVYRIPGRPFY